MFDICPKVTIDLSAIKENYKIISDMLGKDVIASAVVKNDAYGLGAQKVSQALYEIGCTNFWTAYIKEAIDIRRVLPFDANIFFLQGFSDLDIDLMETYRVTPVINSIEDFHNVKNRGIGFVLHIDSGLSRLGLRSEDIDEILPLLKNEKVYYIISHLACSDERNNELNLIQKASFDKNLAKIREVIDVKAGLSASGGVLLGKEYNYDMVRIGAFLYGIQATPNIKLKNVFSLKTSVLQRYKLPPDSFIGYGATFKTKRETTLAVISIGYADGIKCSLSNKGIIEFYDKLGKVYRAPILGRISMDLIACDVTDIPEELARVSASAIVIDENYSINEMAIDAGTIPYEILTSINFKSKRFSILYKE